MVTDGIDGTGAVDARRDSGGPADGLVVARKGSKPMGLDYVLIAALLFVPPLVLGIVQGLRGRYDGAAR